MIRALISIGTNSTRALVARFAGGAPETLLHRSTGTRIGEGLRETGHVQETAMQRTLDAISEHACAIRELVPQFRIIATSALRRAGNSEDFLERVRRLTGVELEIISGEEEAACSFVGALSGVHSRPAEIFGVLDVGGGSSEYAVGTKDGPRSVVSCEIGAVRLSEAFPQLSGSSGAVDDQTLQNACEYAGRALGPAFGLTAGVEQVVLVGGSATTTVSLLRGRREFFSYAPLPLDRMRRVIEHLAATPLAERKKLAGMNPQRADILLAGLLIIEQLCAHTGHSTPLVSTSDVLLGYLLRHPD